MFERYNEGARNVLLSSRAVAGELGSAAIYFPHLLLAILREAPELFHGWLHSETERISLREILESQGRGTAPDSAADVPLSNDCQTVLTLAAEDADSKGHYQIQPAHLLSALLRADERAVDALRKAATTLKEARVVFVVGSKGTADHKTEAADLFRLIEQLPPSQLGKARVLLEALVDESRGPARVTF